MRKGPAGNEIVRVTIPEGARSPRVAIRAHGRCVRKTTSSPGAPCGRRRQATKSSVRPSGQGSGAASSLGEPSARAFGATNNPGSPSGRRSGPICVLPGRTWAPRGASRRGGRGRLGQRGDVSLAHCLGALAQHRDALDGRPFDVAAHGPGKLSTKHREAVMVAARCECPTGGLLAAAVPPGRAGQVGRLLYPGHQVRSATRVAEASPWFVVGTMSDLSAAPRKLHGEGRAAEWRSRADRQS
jgi:hypothetical protein